MSELIAKQILAELQTISGLLRSQLQPVQPLEDSLPTRTSSEHDDYMAATIPINVPDLSAFGLAPVEQPAPPPLPSTTRTKWTPEMEQILHDATIAKPGSYRNSIKHILNKLPNGTSITSIRNKCSRLGYSVRDGYIHTTY